LVWVGQTGFVDAAPLSLFKGYRVPCQNSMHGRGPGVSLAELGSFSVFVDHVSEELMMPDRGVEQGHRVGPWGGGWCRGLFG
jgi:hypothetical protein